MFSRWRYRVEFGVIVALVISLVIACQSSPPTSGNGAASPTDSASTLILNGTGASFPWFFYERLFSEYRQIQPQVLVNYQPTGSAAGIQQLISKTVDFAASDIAMTDAEITQVADGVVMIPMTAGSIAIAYNLPDLDRSLNLSRQAYTDIFLGKVTRWNDPVIAAANPGVDLPDLPVVLIHRSDGSGTTAALTAHLSAISPEWEAAVGEGLNVAWPTGFGVKANAGVSAQIQQAAGAIGYVEYSYAKKLGLSLAALENQAGNFVLPSTELAAAGLREVELPENLRGFVPDPQGAEAYPIVTYSWLLLYQTYADPAQAEALKGLLQWGLTTGQEFSAELGYVPLPEAVVQKAIATLAKVEP